MFIFSLQPFVITRTAYIHNRSQILYQISFLQFIYDFIFTSCKVTYSLFTPALFTIRPFLIVHFLPIVSKLQVAILYVLNYCCHSFECPPFDVLAVVRPQVYFTSKGVFILYSSLKLFINHWHSRWFSLNKENALYYCRVRFFKS